MRLCVSIHEHREDACRCEHQCEYGLGAFGVAGEPNNDVEQSGDGEEPGDFALGFGCWVWEDLLWEIVGGHDQDDSKADADDFDDEVVVDVAHAPGERDHAGRDEHGRRDEDCSGQ